MSLENFEIIRRLGEGAFSSVFKVNRKSDGQCYALKKVKLGSLSIKEKENALNEIRILASLSHPNIIAYKDSFIDEASNTLCIVMELAEAGDLFKKINEHKKNLSHFPEFEIMCALVQITNGLKYLHSANIIHRDLKCANIFISNDGTFKLGDLNISKVQRGGMARTQTGTPYYASPEVWKDKPYTFSSDIWSLGCVIYEMAALDPPFTASDMQSLFKKITKGDYPSLPHIYSENLSSVLKRLLQLNPVNRPTCDKILEFSPVQKFKNLNPSSQQTLPDLLKTIKFEPSLQNLRSKLPSPQYENRGFSAKIKLKECSSNREIGSRREFHRYESLHSRESPKMPLGRQVSLEAIERNRGRNMLRLDGELPDVIGRYQKPPLISPEKYARKIEEIINRQFPDSKVKHLNKVGAMIIDVQRPPVKIPPVNYGYLKEPGILNIAVNPMWL
jgi:NIMA (never in mitosis gene a)-related kinase